MGNRERAARPSRAVVAGLGVRVRRRREALGLSTRDLARLVRGHGGTLDHAKISRVEAEGASGGLTLPNFRALCLALSVSADWLLMLPQGDAP